MPITAPRRDFCCKNGFDPCCQSLLEYDPYDDTYDFVGRTSLRVGVA
jgi:hypothetical protein